MYIRTDPGHLLISLDIKDEVMFRPGTCSAEVSAQSERLNGVIPEVEIQHFRGVWLPSWKEKWAGRVQAPVIFALVEDDTFFEATTQEIESCVAAFRKSVRVDGSLIGGAPHSLVIVSYLCSGLVN